MRPVRKILFVVLWAQASFQGTTAHAGVRECWDWLSGHRASPLLSRPEKMARRLARERASNPRYKPEWKPYDPKNTSGSELITDPNYFWYSGNL